MSKSTFYSDSQYDTQHIVFTGWQEKMCLWPHKYLTLPDKDMIVLGDVHLGKAEHFQKNGIGIPNATTKHTLEYIDDILMHSSLNHLIILGDMFHSLHNTAIKLYQQWLFKHNNRKITLVMGNHDILDHSVYMDLGLNVTKMLQVGQLILTHEPLDIIPDGFRNLSAHIHPCVVMKGRGKQTLRIPCFYFGVQQGYIPAFGLFTGMHTIKPKTGDYVFGITAQQVIRLST